MSKIRVYELAKELNKSSRDIIVALKRNGTTVESHMSLIPDEAAEKVREYFKNNGGTGRAKKGSKSKTSQTKAAAKPKSTATAAAQKNADKPAKDNTSGRHHVMSHGTIDSRGNFVMSSDAVPAQKETKPQTQKSNETESAVKKDNPVKEEQIVEKSEAAAAEQAPAGNDQPVEAKTVQKEDVAASASEETAKTSASSVQAAQENVRRTVRSQERTRGQSSEHGETRTRTQTPPSRERRSQDRNQSQGGSDNRSSFSRNTEGRSSFHRNNRPQGQGRSFSRDNNRDRNSGAPGQNRQGQRRFNLNSAINKEVVPSKDASRDGRRSHKDNRDKDSRRGGRDFDEMRERGSHGSRNKNNSSHSRNHKKPASAPKPVKVQEKVTSIEIPETITIKELADKMKIPAAQIIKKQFLAGNVYTINSDVSFEEAENIAIDYDILCEHEQVVDIIEEMLKDEEDSEENMIPRPPVVCVMGHVDHGKTSILDAIRKTNVTSGEAGGITQHIGAYVVDVKGQKITFLDTPGHEAFTAMRLRGAQSTDIAILVVAADDGVMPQTVEAINHAKAAGIDIIVAINKIDKPGANVDRVKQELMEYDLVAEDWGGKTIMVPVSAHTGEGLDELLDMILLDAEVLDLKANPRRKGRGVILEAQLDKGRGAVATVLVQKGTLRVGDNVTCGTAYGKIRAMIDDKGKRVKTAGPSTPVEVLGLNSVPESGEVFLATDSEKEARSMAETFIATNREKMLQETRSRLSLDSLFEQIKEGQIKELNIVVKADVQGSVEALKQSLTKLSNDEVAVKVIHGGVGAINESDVILASASNAIVLGFNVRPDNQAKAVAEQEHVDIRLYRVIYNAIEDIEAAMKGMLEPEYQEKIIGHAEVRQTYKVSGVGTIIGGYVQDGQITRSCRARLIRDNVVMYDGELGSLKRFKDDVKEVNAGFEFGMSFDKYNDIKEGDQVEAYVMEEVPR